MYYNSTYLTIVISQQTQKITAILQQCCNIDAMLLQFSVFAGMYHPREVCVTIWKKNITWSI